MTADTALRFWLRWAEREGALSEPAVDATLVVLPDGLRQAVGLPDEVSLTADPGVAREDGAVLLGPGHPALDHATEDVLRRGDVGHVSLAVPAAAPPDSETLLARARDALPVGHGRIDLAGAAEPERVPVLRAGALVTYTVALHERFQERGEAWLAVPDRVCLPAEMATRLAGAPRDTALPATRMPDGIAEGVAAAHREIDLLAADRHAVLVSQFEVTRTEEVARTTAYYDAALAAIDRRRETGSPERRPVLEAKLEATRAERARRLAEVEEKFQPRHEVRLFRLHLVWVPALRLPLLVRRGRREFPLTMRWLTPVRGFLPVRCPSCGGPGPFEAAKDRLGCERCIRRAPAPAAPGSNAAPGNKAAAGRPASVASAPPARRDPGAPARDPAGRTPRQPPAPSPAQPPAPSPTRSPGPAHLPAPRHRPLHRVEEGREVRARLVEAGNKLAVRLWQAVSDGDRRLGRMLTPDSPAAVLHRLYGARGPAWMLGLEPGEPLLSVSATTLPGGSPTITWGVVDTAGSGRAYTLRWLSEQGRPGVLEVLPVVGGPGLRLPRALGPRTCQAPEPRVELDPVAATVWRTQLPEAGLPLAVRGLAAWWRVADQAPLAEHDPAALAAAVIHQVGRRAGFQLTYAQVAAACAAGEPQARRAGAALRPLLALTPDRPW